ncbi:helix-hairpin-helix domain-containing protein [Marinobacter sp. CHS3-4]|uniref:helix-hairpin-helix domain-containing protein n=1 Tax=Marinobacter sp. CHS3-4 TaxID=3045174 RepID=UPI0024B5A11E|nr:helix-hairpin-helix domain-containing protein [Marinobacter sp. CHS3-4]MDI9245407.1 helix-hairpin-helix domain-containing protein [Marinobacter sp. CHS3-4]
MGKKASKPNVDKVVERVNKEFEKSSERIEKLINDALKQFDGLQNQIQEPVKKLLKEVDELRDREVKRFTDEFDRRMDEFHELQNSVMERLGISGSGSKGKSKASAGKKKSTASKTKKASTKKPAAKKTAAKKPAAKKTAAKKPAAKKAPAKAADNGDLTRVKGIGPATAKKMKEAGISSIEQIANPSAADQEKLAAFSNVKGFSTFSAEAKKLL